MAITRAVLFFIFMLACTIVNAQRQDRSLDREQLGLEHERLTLERERAQATTRLEQDKLALERERLALSRGQAAQTNWTALSVLFSALLGSGALAFSFYNLRKQAELQIELQRDQAMLQFQIKAAEIALSNARSGYFAYQWAMWLRAIFGDRLPATFGKEYKQGDPAYDFGNSVERKLELMKLVADKAPNIDAITDTWRKLNPKDNWFELFDTPQSERDQS
jgi:hypothetical protein